MPQQHNAETDDDEMVSNGAASVEGEPTPNQDERQLRPDDNSDLVEEEDDEDEDESDADESDHISERP